MATLFTSPGEWAGGGYELAIEYPNGVADAHKALVALWTHSSIAPGYAHRHVDPNEQAPLSVDELVEAHHVHGRCCLNGVAVVSHSVVIAYDDASAWLYFGFPMASLGRAYPVGAYPFDDGSSLAWREEVDGWLRWVAEYLFAESPFRCALIGHEPEESVAEQVSIDAVPAIRWEGIVVPTPGGLAWFPPTERFPCTFDDKNHPPGG